MADQTSKVYSSSESFSNAVEGCLQQAQYLKNLSVTYGKNKDSTETIIKFMESPGEVVEDINTLLKVLENLRNHILPFKTVSKNSLSDLEKIQLKSNIKTLQQPRESEDWETISLTSSTTAKFVNLKIETLQTDIGFDAQYLKIFHFLQENVLDGLDLSGTNIGFEGIEFIFRWCKQSKLRKLNLSKTKIDNNALESLPKFELLEDLDISHNTNLKLGKWPDLFLGESMRHLNISGNPLKNIWSLGITGKLKTCKLLTLNLRNCELDETPVSLVVEQLCKNTTITSLDLGNNPLGDGGAISIRLLLSENKTIQVLMLDGCGITKFGYKKICQDFETHPLGLKLLNLENNPFIESDYLFINPDDWKNVIPKFKLVNQI